ncbi:MAG: NifB/NifX family molybdenum-iron cluster-binding protein [bacterium]
MKIAISATGETTSDTVDPRFGRCQYFLFFDPNSENIETVKNEDNVNAQGGAGVQAAELVANHGADVVITGHCGPKAFSAFQESGIKVFSCSDCTVGQALEKFKKGELVQLQDSTVQGHWM